MNASGPGVLHGQQTCLIFIPPDEFYRWQVAHGQVSISYLPDYWAARARRRAEHGA